MTSEAGGFLRGMRVRAGLSQAEAARRMGVASGTVRAWESNTNDIPLGRFITFCEVAGADAECTLRLLKALRARRRQRGEL